MNKIQKYFQYRQSLIDQYIRGDMSKSEYLQRNLDAVLDLQIEPFTNIDTPEKGLFNYQYYNAMAKEAKAESTGRARYEYENKNEMLREADHYYYLKDKSTAVLLRLLDFENVTAYYIKVHSKYLKGKLYEIVLSDYNAILHSKSQMVLTLLKNAGVFTEETRMSLIDGYINQRY